MGERFRREQLGRTVLVLAERTAGPGSWQGLSGNYLRVRFPWPASDPRQPGLVPVRLARMSEDGVLEGEGAGVVGRP